MKPTMATDLFPGRESRSKDPHPRILGLFVLLSAGRWISIRPGGGKTSRKSCGAEGTWSPDADCRTRVGEGADGGARLERPRFNAAKTHRRHRLCVR